MQDEKMDYNKLSTQVDDLGTDLSILHDVSDILLEHSLEKNACKPSYITSLTIVLNDRINKFKSDFGNFEDSFYNILD